MTGTLSHDTAIALMQASQPDSKAAAERLKNARASMDIEKATAAAEEFEAVFVAEMMKPMFEGISTEAPFGGGKGEEIFRGMMLDEYGKMIAKTGAIGMTTQVRDEMIRMQEAANSKINTPNLTEKPSE
jgi:flagellar protein FlgJ